jgi:hypothetical protein
VIVFKFILQIQGKFKRQPRGILYAGAEVSEPMKLGLLTKGYVSGNFKMILNL